MHQQTFSGIVFGFSIYDQITSSLLENAGITRDRVSVGADDEPEAKDVTYPLLVLTEIY